MYIYWDLIVDGKELKSMDVENSQSWDLFA